MNKRQLRKVVKKAILNENEYNIDINNPEKIRLPALVYTYQEMIEYHDGGIQTEYDEWKNVFFINKRNKKYQIDSDLTSDIVFKLKL